MSRMFSFDPDQCSAAFAEHGYVHIPNGLLAEFHRTLVSYIDESFQRQHLKEFDRGDKQQAMFEFLEPQHYDELRDIVGTVCGVDPVGLTLSERHIKEYEPGADPFPLAHKDRFGSEFSVGFSIRVPQGSTLVLYPDYDVSVNPFNSTAELRSSFSPGLLPEAGMKSAARVEIQDRAGDVQIFRGNAIWHLREHGAGTVVLYLKFNTYNCDTLGEDPHTSQTRQNTIAMLEGPPSTLAESVPVLGRRVDYVHRRFSRDWSDLYGAVLYGQPHVNLSPTEFKLLQSMNGKRTLAELTSRTKQSEPAEDISSVIQQLARRGIVDLLSYRIEMGQQRESTLAQVA